MAFAMITAAFTIAAVATAAIIALAALAFMTFAMFAAGIIVAIGAIAVAAATAGASAHLLVHRISHFLIAGSGALLDGDAEVLIHHGEHIIQQLARLQEALAQLILHHSRTQLVKLVQLLLRRGHTLHVLVTQGLTILAHLAEKVCSFRILVEKTNASLGGHHFLAICKCGSQLTGQLC